MSRLVAREAITPTNQSPIFLIVSWISQATVLFAVGVKVLLSYTSTGVHMDDWCILVAAVMSAAQVVAVSFQGMNGTGKVQASLSHYELDIYQKAAYTAEILYVLTLAISKMSVVLFLYQITPFKLWRRITALVGVFTALWGLSSVFVVAFQCHGPRKWEVIQSQCINRIAFWTANSTVNIMIELALIFVPLTMFFLLISSTYKKLILMFCFSLRFSVIAVVALQLYYLHHRVYPSGYYPPVNQNDDYTFSTWPVFLTAQIIQSLSIITTCIPFMRTLFLGLETGMIQTGHVSRRKVSEAVTSRRQERPNYSSSQLSGWRVNANDAGSPLLFDPSQPRNGSTVDYFSGRLSDASTLSENPRTPRELVFHRRNSGSTTDGSRHPTTPTFPRRSSESLTRLGQEHNYSRRHVSMIVEEEEEPRYIDVPATIPDTTAMLEDGVEIERPETTLNARSSSGRLSIPWRSSYGSGRSASRGLEASRRMAEPRGSASHVQRQSRHRSSDLDYTEIPP